MAPSQTELESRVIELAEKSFKTFCGDISGMFSVDMVCSRQQVGPETVIGLKTRFKDFIVVYSVKAEGELDGTFQLVFDRQGLFILAGVVAMHPEQMILENIESASLEKAGQLGNILTEVGDALVGAWDRVFQKELDGHDRFVQTNTFIGSPWDDSEKKIGLAGDEELMFVPYEMTVGPCPTFKCGIIFPKAILAGKSKAGSKAQNASEAAEDAESKAQNANEAVEDAESKTTNVSEGVKEAESKAPNVSEAVEDAESKTTNVSEGVKEAESKAPNVSEAVDEAESGAPNVSEEEAESRAPNVSEGVEKSKPQEPADEKAAEEKTKAEKNTKEAAPTEGDATAEKAESAAKEAIAADKSAAQQDPEDAVDRKPEAATEGQPEVATEQERPAVAAEEPKAAPEEKTEAAAEQKSDDVNVKAPLTAEADKSEKRPISGAIQKMTRSSAVLPGEPTPSVMAEKLPLGSEDASLALCAKDIMQINVIWGDPDDSVQKALATIQQRNGDYMMIGRGKIPEGVVSKSDLTGALSPYLRPTFSKWRRPMDDATLQIKVKWVMNKPTCTVTPETALPAMMEHICKAGRLCLPVVDQQGKVQGLVTVFDIFKVLLKSSHRG
ncbi:MAG TPA: CBS domain-containing protein [Planctomycetes bacterium]|nr:CBS domain-containing protein [Planctomycetota bacterium]